MKVVIVARRIEVPDYIKEHAEAKFNKIAKFFDEDNEVKITFSKERGRIKGEATIIAKGTVFRTEQFLDSFTDVIDQSVIAIERQILKNKTRLSKKLRAGAVANIAPEVSKAVEEETEFKIIKTKRHGVKPMSPEEAILQMNLLGHDFFIFVNDMKDEKNLVYRRKDGNYGLIEMGE